MDELNKEAEREECSEEAVGAERRVVTVKCTFNGALDLYPVPVDDLADLSTCVRVGRWNSHVEGCLGRSISGNGTDGGTVEML